MLFLLGAFGTLGNIDGASGGDDDQEPFDWGSDESDDSEYTPETTTTDSGGVEISEENK